MAVLTIPQIAQVAVNAGIQNGQSLFVCVAIALAESGGDTRAVNTANSNGTIDRGEWQINSVHDDKLPGRDRFDVDVNAQLMSIISSGGTNWQPWSTFNNGAYQKHLSQVMSELGGATVQPGPSIGGAGLYDGNGFTVNNASLVSGTQQVGFSLSGATDAISTFFGLITSVEGWIRILKVYCGVVALFAGLTLVMASSGVGKGAVKVAGSLVPVGKVAKVAGAAKAATAAKAAAA